jgi:uncharacterized membrane protein YgcG
LAWFTLSLCTCSFFLSDNVAVCVPLPSYADCRVLCILINTHIVIVVVVHFVTNIVIRFTTVFSDSGQLVAVTAVDGEYPTWTDFTAHGVDVSLHTSCSQPLYIGLEVVFSGVGSITITGFVSTSGRTESECSGGSGGGTGGGGGSGGM